MREVLSVTASTRDILLWKFHKITLSHFFDRAAVSIILFGNWERNSMLFIVCKGDKNYYWTIDLAILSFTQINTLACTLSFADIIDFLISYHWIYTHLFSFLNTFLIIYL